MPPLEHVSSIGSRPFSVMVDPSEGRHCSTLKRLFICNSGYTSLTVEYPIVGTSGFEHLGRFQAGQESYSMRLVIQSLGRPAS
jgi:hypothetical protein